MIFYGIFLFLCDLIFLFSSFVLAYYIRFNSRLFAQETARIIIYSNYMYYSLIYIFLSVVIFTLNKLYNWDSFYVGSGYFSRIVRSIIVSIVIMILLGYLYETFSFSRIWIGFLFIFSVFFMILSRYTIYKFTNKIVKKLGLSSRTLIVGTNEEAKRIEESLKNIRLKILI